MELIHLDRTQYPSILKSIESSSTLVTINMPARLSFIRQRTCECKSHYHLILGFKYEMLEGTTSEKLLFKIYYVLCTILFVPARLSQIELFSYHNRIGSFLSFWTDLIHWSNFTNLRWWLLDIDAEEAVNGGLSTRLPKFQSWVDSRHPIDAQIQEWLAKNKHLANAHRQLVKNTGQLQW